MTTATDTDRTEARLTKLEDFQMDTLERLARLESKVDALTAVVEILTVTVRETNRRIDRLFYLGAATGVGIIAALLLQPLIAAIGS